MVPHIGAPSGGASDGASSICFLGHLSAASVIGAMIPGAEWRVPVTSQAQPEPVGSASDPRRGENRGEFTAEDIAAVSATTRYKR